MEKSGAENSAIHTLSLVTINQDLWLWRDVDASRCHRLVRGPTLVCIPTPA